MDGRHPQQENNRQMIITRLRFDSRHL